MRFTFVALILVLAGCSAPPPTAQPKAGAPEATTTVISNKHPLAKYLELSGYRIAETSAGKLNIKFAVVNHSEADINGLAGNVSLFASTQKSEEDAQGTFSFTTNLGPFESKELTVPLTTKRKIYELADWQNITTDVQITGPQ